MKHRKIEILRWYGARSLIKTVQCFHPAQRARWCRESRVGKLLAQPGSRRAPERSFPLVFWRRHHPTGRMGTGPPWYWGSPGGLLGLWGSVRPKRESKGVCGASWAVRWTLGAGGGTCRRTFWKPAIASSWMVLVMHLPPWSGLFWSAVPLPLPSRSLERKGI